MSGLCIFCRTCGKETPSNAADSTGLCVICIVADVVLPLKAEYKRLWAKRHRYLQHRSIPLGHIEKQLARVARRLGDQVHARISNPQLAIATINAHLEQARNEVEYPSVSRIHLPKPGDMTRRLKTA